MSPLARSRAKTIQTLSTPENLDSDNLPLSSSPDQADANEGPDIFEKRDSTDSDMGTTAQPSEQLLGHAQDLGHESHTLPIELASLTDRYN
jgi:hypothetical protein